MTEIQPVALKILWLQPMGLLVAAGLITMGLVNAYRALWIWWLCRNKPVVDPAIAKLLVCAKPPPYLSHAIVWTTAGVILAILCFALGSLP